MVKDYQQCLRVLSNTLYAFKSYIEAEREDLEYAKLQAEIKMNQGFTFLFKEQEKIIKGIPE